MLRAQANVSDNPRIIYCALYRIYVYSLILCALLISYLVYIHIHIYIYFFNIYIIFVYNMYYIFYNITNNFTTSSCIPPVIANVEFVAWLAPGMLDDCPPNRDRYRWFVQKKRASSILFNVRLPCTRRFYFPFFHFPASFS